MDKKKKSLPKWLQFGGQHYTIQRFGLLIGFVSMILLLCVGSGVYSQYKYDANRLTTVASYTKEFKTKVINEIFEGSSLVTKIEQKPLFCKNSKILLKYPLMQMTTKCS